VKATPEVFSEVALSEGSRRSWRLFQFRHLDPESRRAPPGQDGPPWGLGVAGQARIAIHGMAETPRSSRQKTRVWCRDVWFDRSFLGARPAGDRRPINPGALPTDRAAFIPGLDPFHFSTSRFGN